MTVQDMQGSRADLDRCEPLQIFEAAIVQGHQLRGDDAAGYVRQLRLVQLVACQRLVEDLALQPIVQHRLIAVQGSACDAPCYALHTDMMQASSACGGQLLCTCHMSCMVRITEQAKLAQSVINAGHVAKLETGIPHHNYINMQTCVCGGEELNKIPGMQPPRRSPLVPVSGRTEGS